MCLEEATHVLLPYVRNILICFKRISGLGINREKYTVPTFNFRTKCAGSYYTTAHHIATKFPGSRCMYDLITERSYDSQATYNTWVINMLGLSL